LAAGAPGPVWAAVGAVAFGGTFMGVVALTMAAGRDLDAPRAVPQLTAGYALGQVAGPVVTGAVADAGYGTALWIGAGTVALAAVWSVRAGRPGSVPLPPEGPAEREGGGD
jgi:hypothetical protein